MALSTGVQNDQWDRVRPRREPGPLSALRRRWPLVALATALAALAAYAVSALALPSVYRSSATVIVHNQAAILPDEGAAPIEPFVDDQSLSETFEQLALQPSVSDPVARQLDMRPSRLRDAVEVHAVPRTPLVEISFEADSPAAAARGAQAYTAQFVTATQRASYLPGRVLVVSGATRPVEPVGPRELTNALVAGAAALALSLALVLAMGAAASRREELVIRDDLSDRTGLDSWRPDAEDAARREHSNGRGSTR